MLTMKQIIARKRDGYALTSEEIKQVVSLYTQGKVPDYQASAWLMACFLKGLNEEETLALTEAMAASGEQLDLSSIPEPTVDKHSTGGVGDKISLVLVPLLAAGGAHIAKMSGRGLGFTGGTVDKLESIPGFRTDLSKEEILAQVKAIGGCLVGQSEGLVPADKKLYALRDATATVESVPLIASSIMSKKLACGAKTILLDVKCGSGSFMSTRKQAEALAQALIDIGRRAGRNMTAVISDMNQPLGRTVGNAIEAREAIETLTPGLPKDSRFLELCLELAAQTFTACRLTPTLEEGEQKAKELLQSGSALEKFRQMVEAQGGDSRVIDDLSRLPSAPVQQVVLVHQAGWIARIDSRAVAEAAADLGAGRQTKEDAIDPAVGIEVFKHKGDPAQSGEPLFVIHARTESAAQQAEARLRTAIEFSKQPVAADPVIITRSG